MEAPAYAPLLAVVPIALLAVLVLRNQPLTRTAWLCAGVAALLGMTVFRLGLEGVGLAALRGLWTGAWILLIVLPALLLFEVLSDSGALDRLADAADLVAPSEGRRLLLLAWVLPSFLQGAAGFGAPIAMSAPMLVRRGMAPVAAVAACLIGYQWSVTFGSMGSSYFMAAATARLGEAAADGFALRAAAVLAVTAAVSGLLVLRRARTRTHGDLGRMLVLALLMGGTLILVVRAQPALGSTVAGLVGLIAAWFVLPDRGTPRPEGGPLIAAALPYLALTASATVGFGIPAVRELLARVPAVAPVLAGSTAAFGHATPAAALSPAFRPLLHPLPYLSLAVLVGVVVYRRRGWWPAGSTRRALRRWLPRCRAVGASILGLTVLAAMLVEAGMVAAVAGALARALGIGFLAVSAPIGTLGTMLTGSTTASNALFSALQAEVAVTLGLLPAILLAGQTAGGNIGNTISPATVAVGTAAAGSQGREGEVIRRNLAGAGLLLAVVFVGLLLMRLW